VAALNNAAWCDVVCRLHGLATVTDADAWTSPARTPPYYPDAVTLMPEPSRESLLARIDDSPGCSIKDSFAALDLSPFGFDVLFDAEWIVRIPSGPGGPRVNPTGPPWEVVATAVGFEAWERAWRGGDGPAGVLQRGLLDEPSVRMLATRDGERVTAGAILNQAGGAIGVSNFFAGPVHTDAWAACLALTSELFPASTVVGYEAGSALEAALDAGFSSVGPLRVWLLQSLDE
jgi:hypothetical protein